MKARTEQYSMTRAYAPLDTSSGGTKPPRGPLKTSPGSTPIAMGATVDLQTQKGWWRGEAAPQRAGGCMPLCAQALPGGSGAYT